MRGIALVVLLDGGGSGDSSAHAVCISETNRYRQMNGKTDVTCSTQLEDVADTGAMVDFGGSPHQHFSSTSGGGSGIDTSIVQDYGH